MATAGVAMEEHKEEEEELMAVDPAANFAAAGFEVANIMTGGGTTGIGLFAIRHGGWQRHQKRTISPGKEGHGKRVLCRP